MSERKNERINFGYTDTQTIVLQHKIMTEMWWRGIEGGEEQRLGIWVTVWPCASVLQLLPEDHERKRHLATTP